VGKRPRSSAAKNGPSTSAVGDDVTGQKGWAGSLIFTRARHLVSAVRSRGKHLLLLIIQILLKSNPLRFTEISIHLDCSLSLHFVFYAESVMMLILRDTCVNTY
jgi:hypothetical protein